MNEYNSSSYRQDGKWPYNTKLVFLLSVSIFSICWSFLLISKTAFGDISLSRENTFKVSLIYGFTVLKVYTG